MSRHDRRTALALQKKKIRKIKELLDIVRLSTSRDKKRDARQKLYKIKVAEGRAPLPVPEVETPEET